MKEVEGTITAEEALRFTYKLIFKQDLKEIRECRLFTETDELMQILQDIPVFLMKQKEAKSKL